MRETQLPPFQAAQGRQGGAPGAPTPRLDPDNVAIANLYSRIYCAILDPNEQKLVLYRFFKCAPLPLSTATQPFAPW